MRRYMSELLMMAYLCCFNSYDERSTADPRLRLQLYSSRAAGVGYNEDGSARTDAPGNCRYCREDVESPQPPTFNGVRGQVNTYRLAFVVECSNVLQVCEILHRMRQSFPSAVGTVHNDTRVKTARILSIQFEGGPNNGRFR